MAAAPVVLKWGNGEKEGDVTLQTNMLDLMAENTDQNIDRPPVGNLTDFAEGVDKNNHLDIEVAVNESGKVVVFHNRRFKKEISWFEFDLATCKLDFVLDDGDVRDAGLPLSPNVAKYMQNSHQILTVLLDDDTGEATEGQYVPLIIHQS